MKHEVIIGRTIEETRGDPVRVGIPLRNTDGSFRTLAEIEQAAIDYALSFHDNRSEAARALGLGRSTLYRKLAESA